MRDRFLRALVRLILKVFFREVEVAGAARIPLDRPLVLVANHVNGLIDPLLLLGPAAGRRRASSPRAPSGRTPLVRPFLDLAGAIPVYRRQDEGSDLREERRDLRPLPRAAGQGGTPRPLPRGDQPQRSRAQAAEDRRRPHRPRSRAEISRPRHPDRARRPPLRRQADLPLARPRAGGGAARSGAGDRPARPRTRSPPSRRPHRPHRRRPAGGHPQLRDLGRRPPDRPRRGPLPPPRASRCRRGGASPRASPSAAPSWRATGTCGRATPEKIAAAAEAVRDYDAPPPRLPTSATTRSEPPTPASPVARFVGRTLLRLLVHLPLAAIGTVLN